MSRRTLPVIDAGRVRRWDGCGGLAPLEGTHGDCLFGKVG